MQNPSITIPDAEWSKALELKKALVAKWQSKARGIMTRDEMMSEANLGLMKAVAKWDPERHSRFSSLAFSWIRGAIAEAVEIEYRRAKRPYSARNARSLDDPFNFEDGPGEGEKFGDMIMETRPNPEDLALESEHRERLLRLLDYIPTRSRLVIRRIFLDGKTVAEVGVEIGVSAQRVYDLRADALRRMREMAQREFHVSD